MKINEENLINSDSFNRLNDIFFKHVLASQERKYLTVEFINSVLNFYDKTPLMVENITFLDRESVARHEGEKVPRFDIFLRSSDGRLIHIEVQDAQDNFFLERSFYYACHDYMLQSERGLGYEKFKPVIFIGLVNFNLMGVSNEPREWYALHKVLNVANNKCNFNNVEFHMIELPVLRQQWRKFKKMPSTKLEKFLFYFGNIGGGKMIQELAEKDGTIADLLEEEKLFRTDPIQMRRYYIEERAKADYWANAEVFRAEGLEQGLEQGLREKAIKVAKALKIRGHESDEDIAEIVGLPVDVVKNL